MMQRLTLSAHVQIMIVGGSGPCQHANDEPGSQQDSADLSGFDVEVVNIAPELYPPCSWPACYPEEGETMPAFRARKMAEKDGTAMLPAQVRWDDYVASGVLVRPKPQTQTIPQLGVFGGPETQNFTSHLWMSDT